ALHLDCSGHRVPGAREREEERVALRVDLGSIRGGERVADESTVVAQHLAVAVTELLEQLGRALDVGEEEGDRPGWERGHGGIVHPLWIAGAQVLAQNRHRGVRRFRVASSAGERGQPPALGWG